MSSSGLVTRIKVGMSRAVRLAGTMRRSLCMSTIIP